MIVLNPYLSFGTNTEEAMNFYQSIFGGKVDITRFTDVPGTPEVQEDYKNLVMHSVLKTDTLQLMAADSAPMGGIGNGGNASVSLSGEGDDEVILAKYFEGLSDGAKVLQPLTKANWGDTFGMLTDKFGITWLINIAAAKA